MTQILQISNGVISRCAKVSEGGCRVRMFQFLKKVGKNDAEVVGSGGRWHRKFRGQ